MKKENKVTVSNIETIRTKFENIKQDMTGKLDLIEAFGNEILTARAVETKAETVEELDKILNKVFKFYAGEAKCLCYAAARASGDPMLYAVEKECYQVLKLQNKDDVRSIVKADRSIELLDLWDRCKGGIGVDPTWRYYAEKFNYRFTARIAEDLGDKENAEKLKAESNYKMSTEAYGFKVPFPSAKADVAISNAQLKQALNTVLHMMVGEKIGDRPIVVNKNDIAFVINSITQLRKGKVKIADHKDFANILNLVLGHIVFNREYKIQSKNIKNK